MIGNYVKKSLFSKCKISTLVYDSQSGLSYGLNNKIQLFVREPSKKYISLSNTYRKLFNHQILKINCDEIHNINNITLKIKSSLNSNVKTRCYINNSFSKNIHRVQTTAALLADAGCESIVLTDDFEVLSKLDEFDLSEVLESVINNDVPGLPMTQRVGLHTIGAIDDNDNHWKSHVQAALNLNIKQFDASLDNRDAPSIFNFIPLLNDQGLEHDLDSAFVISCKKLLSES
eukprot:gene8374-11330_t